MFLEFNVLSVKMKDLIKKKKKIYICFVDIDGIVDYHCLNFLFIIFGNNKKKIAWALENVRDSSHIGSLFVAGINKFDFCRQCMYTVYRLFGGGFILALLADLSKCTKYTHSQYIIS